MLELNSESIIIPSKVSFVLAVIEPSLIDTSIGVVKRKSKWHIPGLALTIIRFEYSYNQV